MYHRQLFIKHKQEWPEYVKIYITNNKQPININKVYIIREDDVDLSYYVMLLPEKHKIIESMETIKSTLETEVIFSYDQQHRYVHNKT